MKKLKIHPLTRIEGDASLEIVFDDQGNLKRLRWLSELFRGFEKICLGRPVEEMPFLTSRICGICAEAHHLASLRAVDQIFGLTPPPWAQKVRAIFLLSSLVRDHLTVLYLFSGPDLKPSPQNREALAWLKENGLLHDFLQSRSRIRRILEIVGGRGLQAVGGFPGSWSKSITAEEKEELIQLTQKERAFAAKTFDFFGEILLKKEYQNPLKIPFLALLPDNLPGFLGRRIGILTSEEKPYKDFRAEKFQEYIVEEDSTECPNLRTTQLKSLGPYLVGPLARFHLWPEPSTPLAQKAYREIKNCLKHQQLRDYEIAHLFRAYEILLACEQIESLSQEIEIQRKDEKEPKFELQREGIGVVEAPRGLLIHHYQVDKKGLITKVNIITPTAQNSPIIFMTIRAYLKSSPKNNPQKLTKDIEKIIRAFDPCVPCMLHIIPSNKDAAKLSIAIQNKSF
ncbi:Ni/Fe hydrogenase subunit alpha [Thermosulfurimonas dismutans]|uniref:Methyl-viologen-reducing hydrogenase, alpha subunit n=1 Tax=Thermosulfurimonas dismutans TaxID=999894 RepID=A0A179D5J0_9BACT|nr:Ni/Fe hydrogenase subunit alpha [Thermosulfurimonas dismutans]OAQ20989.1 Methyl-viologen-reducing hydrogenase, alpha subunit [Thermosulfurimonas dismutans]